MVDNPTPPAPTPKNIQSALWSKIIGAVIAVILFLSFLGMGMANALGFEARFACDGFNFFTVAFSVGGAISAMFLGGGAAAAGNLGEKLQGQSLGVSLTGGVAVLVILFGLFLVLKPGDCAPAPEEAYLELRGIPDSVLVKPGSALWTRKNTHTDLAEYEFFVLVSDDVDEERLIVEDASGEICRFSVSFAERFESDEEGLIYQPFDWTGDSFKLDFNGRTSAERVGAEQGCFFHRGHLLDKHLEVATGAERVRLSRPEPQAAPTIDDFAGGYVPYRAPDLPGGFLIAPAHAANIGMPYDELKRLLGSENPAARQEAREVLAADFASYQDRALADIFAPSGKGQDPLLASLLSGLTGGIDALDEGRFRPASGRDLSVTPRYIIGREASLLAMTANPDPSVRQQARRLIQRFPVDSFIRPIMGEIARAERVMASGRCPEETTGFTVYAAIFFTYNRMVQAGLDGAATTVSEWEGEVERLQTLAEACIPGVEKVDAALLDYGRALAYAWSKNEDVSRAAVGDFQTYISGREGDYYMQGHLTRMTELWK